MCSRELTFVRKPLFSPTFALTQVLQSAAGSGDLASALEAAAAGASFNDLDDNGDARTAPYPTPTEPNPLPHSHPPHPFPPNPNLPTPVPTYPTRQPGALRW